MGFNISDGFSKTAMDFQKPTRFVHIATVFRSRLAPKPRRRLSRPPRPTVEMAFACFQCNFPGPDCQNCTLAWVERAGGWYKTTGKFHYCAACVQANGWQDHWRITEAQPYLRYFCPQCISWIDMSLIQLNKPAPPPGPPPGYAPAPPTAAT